MSALTLTLLLGHSFDSCLCLFFPLLLGSSHFEVMLATLGAVSTLPSLCHFFGWSSAKGMLVGAVCKRTWGQVLCGARNVDATPMWKMSCRHLIKLSRVQTGVEGISLQKT